MQSIVPYLQNRLKLYSRRVSAYIRRNPLKAILILLILLGLSMWASFALREPAESPLLPEVKPHSVVVYGVGEQSSLITSAVVNKTGVVEIVAQAGGVVQDVPVALGQEVKVGQTLARLSTTYSGASSQGIQRRIAAEQYEQAMKTNELQREAIQIQRVIATTSAQNTQEQRELQVAALGETQDLLSLNELMLETVQDSLDVATQSADIQVLRQQKAQLLSAVNQLRSSVRNLQYLESAENPPTQLQQLQEDLTLKQLQIQEQSLALNEDIALLQLQLARVQESLLYPSAPFPATVERIQVSKGQVVNPGQVLFTLKCDTLVTDLIARVSPDVAWRISRIEPTRVFIQGEVIELYPQYVSTVATDGQLHTVVFHLPQSEFYRFTDTAHVQIELPLSAEHTRLSAPYIPIDAVYQTENATSVMVVSESGTAESREIEIGQVTGRYVAVTAGLSGPVQVILDRTVVAGEPVMVE